MIRRAGMALLLVALLLVALVVAGLVPRAAAITGGQAASQDWVRFVARINVGGDKPRSCTGTLIDPQWLLTSANCFASGPDGTVQPGAPAEPTTATIDGRQPIDIDRIVPHPDRDVALARLTLRTTGIAPVPISDTAPRSGDELAVAGSGRTATSWVPDDVQLAAATVDTVTAQTFGIVGPQDSPVTACLGDSGGPVARSTADGPVLVGVLVGSGQNGCLEHADSNAGTQVQRLDQLADWIKSNATALTSTFAPVHKSSGNGIGGYDLKSSYDQVIPYDYGGTGKLDDLLFYRPGSKIAWILEHKPDGSYERVFSTSAGFTDFDLASTRDRVITLDCQRTGKQDCLLLYRPGLDRADPNSAKITILAPDGASFKTVYSQQWPVGLGSANDRFIALDYDHTGRMDHVVLFRPGSGSVIIFGFGPDGFSKALYDSHAGIGGFDLARTQDNLIAFDCHQTGRLDCLLAYRPGYNAADPNSSRLTMVARGTGEDDRYTAIYTARWPGTLGNTADQVIAYDYDRTGRADYGVFYRPGKGWTAVVPFVDGAFQPPPYHSPGGIGGYNLGDSRDRIVAFDNDHTGSATHLLAYRPGAGEAWVIGRKEQQPDSEPQPVQRPDTATTLTETFDYPGAARIKQKTGVDLISGDGHIVIDEDCSTQPGADGVGAMKVSYTVDSGGRKTACFRVLGDTGRLTMNIPNVFSIRGDGYQPDAGHDFVATVDTKSDPPAEIDGESDTYTPVGIGADPDAEPTTLLELRIVR